MAETFSVVWYSAAIIGVVAAAGASLAAYGKRRQLLLIAGACFALAGLLGILSIGIVFLGLSVACFIAAARTPRAASSDGV